MIRAIAANEIRRWFRSPASWLLLTGVFFVLAFLFLLFVDSFDAIRESNLGAETPVGVTQAIVQPFYGRSGILLLLLTPLLTMRSIAGEKHDGTWLLYRLAAISPLQLILGKMLAVSVILSFILLGISLMPLALLAASPIDLGQLASSFLGLWLLTVSFAAAGIWCSSLSSEPVSAAMLHYSLLLILTLFYLSSSLPGVIAPSLYYLAHYSHFAPFLEGRISSEHLAYYLLFTALFLWLAIRHLDSAQARRQG